MRFFRSTVFVCSLASVLALASIDAPVAWGQPKKDEKDKAEEQLAKLNAQVKRDTTKADKPVVEVHVYSQDVSADDLKLLLAFKTIQRIDFHTTKISTTGLAALAELPLEHLNLPLNTKFDNDGLKSLLKIKSLKTLYVPQGEFRKGLSDDLVKQLGTLENLEELHVSYGVSDKALAEALKTLKKLRKLDANNCDVADESMKSLSELPEVRAIELYGSKVSDAGYAHIGKIEKLEELRTSYDITDKGLAELGKLKNLKKLNLWNSSVTIKGVRDLPNLKDLKELDISTQRIKAAEAATLRKELPDCKVIYKKN